MTRLHTFLYELSMFIVAAFSGWRHLRATIQPRLIEELLMLLLATLLFEGFCLFMSSRSGNLRWTRMSFGGSYAYLAVCVLSIIVFSEMK